MGFIKNWHIVAVTSDGAKLAEPFFKIGREATTAASLSMAESQRQVAEDSIRIVELIHISHEGFIEYLSRRREELEDDAVKFLILYSALLIGRNGLGTFKWQEVREMAQTLYKEMAPNPMAFYMEHQKSIGQLLNVVSAYRMALKARFLSEDSVDGDSWEDSMAGQNGDWLDDERDSKWVRVGEYSRGQTLELCESSCYEDDGNIWCVARLLIEAWAGAEESEDDDWDEEDELEDEVQYSYMGCFIPRTNEVVTVLVDRLEEEDGSVLREDRWNPKLVMHPAASSAVNEMASMSRQFARSNAYLNPPALVHQAEKMLR